jgi:peptidyl-prolyl cis-trans isomerase D
MIQLIHKYKQSIAWVFLFVALCFALSGVGLDILQGGAMDQRNAVVVNDKKFDFDDLGMAQRRIENQYRQMFGDNYQQLLASFNVNTRQQAVDNLVDSELLQQQAHELGLTAGDAEIRKYILTRVFNQGDKGSTFSPEAYRGMLQGMGMSARQFEGQVAQDLARVALVGLLQDTAYVSAKDVTQRYIQQEAKYSFVTASYDSNLLISEVPTPSEQELQKFYETNATDYELPARVAYDYIVLAPKDFEKDVNVQAQDIEVYYADNASKFSSPEQIRARSIKLLYPKESDPKKMAAVREKAVKAREEALSGKPFELLVTTYSDDLPSKAVGGSRGWIVRGKESEAFDKAAFSTAVGGVSELIEADFGFEIVKVEERKESGTSDLAEVRAEIERELRTQEAPAYAAAKARELVERAKKENKRLAEIAPTLGLTVASTATLLNQSNDPSSAPRGLTQQVMMLPAAERLAPAVIDSGDTSVAVQIKEFKEPTTASYEEVKERVLTTYKSREAQKLAETKAKDLLEAAKKAPADFKKESEARKATFKGPFEISRAKPSTEGFAGMTPEMSKAILASTAVKAAPTQYFVAGSQYVVTQVTEIKKPDPTSESAKQELAKYSEQAQEQSRKEAIESTVGLLKSRASIDIDPAVLVN